MGTTPDPFDGFALVDRERSACLCDVGMPGHSIAVAVTSTGDTSLWLVDDAALGAKHQQWGNDNQPHEQQGPLPEHWRHRVDQVFARRNWPRCGRPRKDGRPCRAPVARHGQHCSWHRDVQQEAERQAPP